MNIISINHFDPNPLWSLTVPCKLEWANQHIKPIVYVSVDDGVATVARSIIDYLAAIFTTSKEIRERTRRADRRDICIIGKSYPQIERLLVGLNNNLMRLRSQTHEQTKLICDTDFYYLSSRFMELSGKFNNLLKKIRELSEIYDSYVLRVGNEISKKVGNPHIPLCVYVSLYKVVLALELPQTIAVTQLQQKINRLILDFLKKQPPVQLASVNQYLRFVLNESNLTLDRYDDWFRGCETILSNTEMRLERKLIEMRDLLYRLKIDYVLENFVPQANHNFVRLILSALITSEQNLIDRNFILTERNSIYSQVMCDLQFLNIVALNHYEFYCIVRDLTSILAEKLTASKKIARKLLEEVNRPYNAHQFNQRQLTEGEILLRGICSGLTSEWSIAILSNNPIPSAGPKSRYLQVLSNSIRNRSTSTIVESRGFKLKEEFVKTFDSAYELMLNLNGVEGSFHLSIFIKENDNSITLNRITGHLMGLRLNTTNNKFEFWDVNSGHFIYESFIHFEKLFTEYLLTKHYNTHKLNLFVINLISRTSSNI